MTLSNLDKVGDIMPHRAAAAGGGGSVDSVTAGDATITIGGTASDPTVAVTAATFALVGTTMTAGAGLTGGGSLAANRTFDIGAGSGISVAADAVALDLTFAAAWTAAHTWTTTTVPITATITDGAAAAQLEGARIAHTTSTTATAGIGTYYSIWAEDGTGVTVEVGRLVGLLRSVAGTTSNNGVMIVQQNVLGVVTNQGHFINSGVYGHGTFGIAQVSVTGVTTTSAQWSIASTMVNHASSLAANGGHSFTGTVNTSGARSFFIITPSANTGTTASTAVKGFDYQTYTKTWATGAGPAEQVEVSISAPTYAAAAASTFPLCSTFAITGAPIAGTNMTITQGLAFHVQGGGARFDGNFGVYSTTPAAQGTGGQNVTNNVTNSGSTDGTIPDITDGTIYANDYVNLRRALFQIARMLKQDHDQLRANGFLT